MNILLFSGLAVMRGLPLRKQWNIIQPWHCYSFLTHWQTDFIRMNVELSSESESCVGKRKDEADSRRWKRRR
jgi:hypothetical protein